jgi:hypothetical protein
VEATRRIIDYYRPSKHEGESLCQFTFPLGTLERRKLRWSRIQGAALCLAVICLIGPLGALMQYLVYHQWTPISQWPVAEVGGICLSLLPVVLLVFELSARGTNIDLYTGTISVRWINRETGKVWPTQQLRWVAMEPARGTFSKKVMASLYLKFGNNAPSWAGTGERDDIEQAAKSIGQLLCVPVWGIDKPEADAT